MHTKMFARIAAILFVVAPKVVSSANLDWHAAKSVPFTITRGVELGRHADGKTAAKLSLVCSAQGGLHLLLLTRLPISEAYRRNILGRDNDVSLFVSHGTTKELRIVVDLVSTGRNHFESVEEWLTGIDAPDTIITPPLSMAQVTTLESWFGTVPPTKVAVVGILETGVFMIGTRAGDAIRTIREGCAPSSDEPAQ